MLLQLDRALFLSLNRGAANGFFDGLMPRITNLHHQAWFLAATLLLCAALLWRGSRRARVGALCALVAVGASDLAASRLVKPLVVRDRPCREIAATGRMAVPDTRVLRGKPGPLRVGDPRDCPGSRSFPSNHAANMAALAGVGWWFTRPRRRESGQASGWWRAALPLLWFLLPLVIGYSRIYLGYHYPSDVAGGWALGGLIAAGVIAAGRRLLTEAAVPTA